MFKIKELAVLAGISTRTLRYYDKINLLIPTEVDQNGYRFYDSDKIDELQQILFYKELGYSLDKIHNIVKSNTYNRLDSLYEHLSLLNDKKDHIERVTDLVLKTIDTIERGGNMSENEKFEAFKKQQIQENTEKYGDELNQKYDKEFVQEVNRQYQKKTKYEMKAQDELTNTLNETIKKAMKTKDPSSPLAQKMCELHKEWLCFYWPTYDENHHLSLVEMYTLDERFMKYYDKIEVGAAQFLLSAMKQYIQK